MNAPVRSVCSDPVLTVGRFPANALAPKAAHYSSGIEF